MSSFDLWQTKLFFNIMITIMVISTKTVEAKRIETDLLNQEKALQHINEINIKYPKQFFWLPTSEPYHTSKYHTLAY